MSFDMALKKESTRRLRREDGERNSECCSSDMLILIFMSGFKGSLVWTGQDSAMAEKSWCHDGWTQ